MNNLIAGVYSARVGMKCWAECGKTAGPCAFCGPEGLCCRMGWNETKECDGSVGSLRIKGCTGGETKYNVKLAYKLN